jgi:hypothetical protein
MTAIAALDASGLADAVQRARVLLDEGDVMAARLLAAGAYDQAKAAAGYAERFRAGERLVEKARRLQADALLIEARAKVELADQWDSAQAAGQAASKGRPKNIPDEKIFTQAEAGLTAKEIHDARRLRDAERRQPGFVQRVIAARLTAGLEPSRANLRAAIGTDSATAEERGNNLYETPIEAMRTLLAQERFRRKVKEPAVGRGAVLRPLEDAGYEVEIADLVDYGTATRCGVRQDVGDFLESSAGEGRDIVTNPPYGEVLNAFVEHALRVHRPRKMALLLNLIFLAGSDDEDRNYCMDEHPPRRVYVFTRRLPMMHRDNWDGKKASSRMILAWFVWEQDAAGRYAGPREWFRVDWKDFRDAPALPPLDEVLP